MDPSAYRTARLCLLLESGAVEDEHGAAARVAPAQTLVLSRAWCRFRLFRVQPGLTRTQAARAARLHAEAHAPFADAGTLLLRSAAGIAIWYWDKARIAEVYPHRGAAFAPETLYRDAGEGWRIVACAEGFEAQYWESGALVASSWRRGGFERAHWAAFALGVESAAVEAPDGPPEITYTPLQPAARWRRQRISAPLRWQDAETAALALTLACLAGAAFLAGQGLHATQREQEMHARLAVIESKAKTNAGVRVTGERLALIRGYGAAMGDADALAPAAEAFDVLDRYDLEPMDWRVDGEHFRATLSAPASEADLRNLIQGLEDTAALANVVVQFPSGDLAQQDTRLTLTADIAARPSAGRESGAPRAGGTP